LPLIASLREKGLRRGVLLQFHAAVACAAVVLFYTAILGDGNEFQKHLFAFNFLFDACLVADVLWFVDRLAPPNANRSRAVPRLA
jgi:hypothetical protein